MPLFDDQLLQHLHRGISDQPLWEAFLQRLRATTRADLVALSLRHADEAAALVRVVAREAPQRSIHTDLYAGMGQRVGRIYDLGQRIESEVPEQRPAIAAALRDAGISHWRGIRIAAPTAPDLWLSIGGGRDVGAATGALLNSLAPHLAIALGNFSGLERERFRSMVAREAFDRLNAGWLTLDVRGRIIDVTDNLEAMFRSGAVLRRGRYDRLVPVSPEIDRRLTRLLQQLAGESGARPQAFLLCNDPWTDMLVTAAQKTSAGGLRPAVAIAYVRADRRSTADRCEQLVDLFGLLPSEARLAWQLAQARSMADAARSLGLTLETARNYSKKIYAKTGAKGQSDLVRIVMTGMLAIS